MKIIGIIVLLLIIAIGATAMAKRHEAIQCVKIANIVGAEDITIDPITGIAYISSQDRRTKPMPNGKIYTLNMNGASQFPILMKRTSPYVFHPHGITLFQSGPNKFLYVINHRNHDSVIEVFQIKRNELIHLRTLASKLLKSPNDIYAVGVDKIYVTNYKYHNLLYFNNKHWYEVARNIAYSNGISGDLAKNELVVISTQSRKVYYFKINPHTGSLKFIQAYPVGMFGDNLEKDTKGNYWLAGHPNPIKFLLHSVWKNIPSPSRVIIFKQTNEKKLVTRTLFNDKGKQFSASSVAAPYKNEYLIGSVYQSYILRCKIHLD